VGTPFRLCAVAADRDEFVPASSSLGRFRYDQTSVLPGNHSSVVKPSSATDLSVRLVADVIGGYSSVPDVVSQARVAIEARDFGVGVDLLWPNRAELDTNATGLLAAV